MWTSIQWDNQNLKSTIIKKQKIAALLEKNLRLRKIKWNIEIQSTWGEGKKWSILGRNHQTERKFDWLGTIIW